MSGKVPSTYWHRKQQQRRRRPGRFERGFSNRSRSSTSTLTSSLSPIVENVVKGVSSVSSTSSSLIIFASLRSARLVASGALLPEEKRHSAKVSRSDGRDGRCLTKSQDILIGANPRARGTIELRTKRTSRRGRSSTR